MKARSFTSLDKPPMMRGVDVSDRPRCKCHGEPMYKSKGGTPPWKCAVKGRAHSKRQYLLKDRDAVNAYGKQWRAKNLHKTRLYGRRYKYGVTIPAYNAMLERQGGVCAICGAPPGETRGTLTLAVDHDHETGAVRGLLCRRCNSGIGYLGDSHHLLIRAIAYLEKARIANASPIPPP